MKSSTSSKLAPGAQLAPRELTSITGDRVVIPDPRQLVHLQLRRFAGCPVCHLHLHTLVRRRQEIESAHIHEVIVFHSTHDELTKHAADIPFTLIADPEKRLYRELGAEAAPHALLDPRAWLTIARSVLRSSTRVLRGQPLPPLTPGGGRLGLPADFLIAPNGQVVACKYGEHAGDQWSVDELIAHAARNPPTASSHAPPRAARFS